VLRRAFVLCPLSFVLSTAAVSAEPVLMMRLRMNDTQSVETWKASFRAIADHPGCCDEIWLSTGCGVPELAWHRANAAVMAVAVKDLKAAGIVPSLQFQATLGHGDGIIDARMFPAKKWTGWTGPQGTEDRECNCPRQPGFLAYLREVSEIYAGLGFASLWIDDDLRSRNHLPATAWDVALSGCWCKTCVDAYNRETGGCWTRETLAKAVKADPARRASWRRFTLDSLVTVAKTVAETFHAVSPQTKMGLQHCVSDVNVDEISAVLQALHETSGRPVGFRGGGGAYSDDNPDRVLLKSLATGAFRKRLGDPDYVKVWVPEIESHPRTYYSISPQGVLVQAFSGLMYGLNGVSYFISNPAMESPALYGETYWKTLAEAYPCLKGYAEAIKGCEPVGFAVPSPKEVGVLRAAIPAFMGPGQSVGSLTEKELKMTLKNMTSRSVQEFRERLDKRAGGLPACVCSPFAGLMQIHVDSDGCFRTLALLNARISVQGPVRIRLAKIPASATCAVWNEMGRAPVSLPVERIGTSAFVTVPQIAAWNGGYVSFGPTSNEGSCERSFDGWMLPGEEIRGLGCLPKGVTCERVWESDGSARVLRLVLRNGGADEAIVEEGDYGFVFPFDSVFARGREDALDAACVAHVWCGDDVAWVWAGRPNGTNRYFSAILTEGRLSSYSLRCDVSRVSTGACYRGSPVLNPPRLKIPPNGCVRFAFRLCESSRRPDRDLMGPLLVTADDYSPFVGQEVVVRVKTTSGEREEKHRFSVPGEQVIRIEESGKRTFVRFNVLEDVDTLLLRRAKFIAGRQQAGDGQGRLSGAYLVFDRKTGKTVVGKNDHNAGRERLGMGVLMAVAARRSGDGELVRSLERHRDFVLRELFDAETCTVFNDIGRDNAWHRNYNYPWMSVYWLETWRLTQDTVHLRHAAGTLLTYYEKRDGRKHESPCLFVLETIRALEAAGRTEEAARLKAALVSHADDILSRRGRTHSAEVTVTHGGANLRGSILAQALELTGDGRYREELLSELRRASSFFALQPDFHFCAQPVRHWDGFWFGGARLYGDTFPQWLGTLNGEMYWRAGRVLRQPFDSVWRTNLKGLLSAFQSDGFASCAYYPFKTETFVDASGKFAPFAPPGVRHGECWDDWANDQDWSLYFTIRLTKEQ